MADIVLVVEDMYEGEDEDGGHVEGERNEEHEEVPVVPPPYTVIDPGAVVVEYLDAVVADGAVGAPRRPVELARHAPLHPDRYPIDLDISVEGCPKVVVPVLVRTSFWYHAWIHKSCHGKVY